MKPAMIALTVSVVTPTATSTTINSISVYPDFIFCLFVIFVG